MYETQKVYSVTYDLSKPNRDYNGLYDALKSFNKWWHYLDSTWLILSSETPMEIWEKIRTHIDTDDRILIIEVKNNKYGWLGDDAWKWIDENVPK